MTNQEPLPTNNSLDHQLAHEYTSTEIKKDFFNKLFRIIDKMDKKDVSSREKLESCVFHILSFIDGVSGVVVDWKIRNHPWFILAPNPHPDDKEYNQSQNESRYPENHDIDIKAQISWDLHDEFAELRNERNHEKNQS